jgi:hypothetical protein
MKEAAKPSAATARPVGLENGGTHFPSALTAPMLDNANPIESRTATRIFMAYPHELL